jgi:hypothetical protein
VKENECHTHDAEFMKWKVEAGHPHRHPYSTKTSIDRGHRHVMRGVTFIDPGSNMDNHVHSYEGNAPL